VMGKRIVAENLTFCAVIATSFGCPYEGKVPIGRVLGIAEQFAEAGATEIGFGDTTGMCNPAYASRFFTAAIQRLPGVEVTAHFHNTRGQGLANAYAALQASCTRSTGNIATEDLVSMFHEMGVETGLDLGAVIEAAREAQSVLGRKLTSHSLVAGPVPWHPAVG
jgi:hydroxymethylglutaryl-CoA lyase